MEDAIQVMIVDDSALMRNLIGRIVDGEPDLSVLVKAMNGKFALQRLERSEPDVIILDLEMPEMNGIQFLRERKSRGIEVPVIILSSIATKGARVTMEALNLGAADFIPKPSGGSARDLPHVAGQLVEMIRSYGGKHRRERGLETPPRPSGEPATREPPAPEPGGPVQPKTDSTMSRAGGGSAEKTERSQAGAGPRAGGSTTSFRKIEPKAKTTAIELVAIGVSTGGPNALRHVLPQILPEINVPIVVVQHMPEGFTQEFARSLDRVCQLEVKEAADGDLMKAGRVLIAPGNRHLTVERRSLSGIVRVTNGAPVNGHRPSVDVLFESVAQSYANRSLAVIMTGMGRDGAREIGSVYEAGGYTIGQDQGSSIVYGMPKVAFDAGYIMQQVGLTDMAETITRIVEEHRDR